MKKLLLLTCCLVAEMITNAQSPQLAWAKRMGGTLDDGGSSITVDASGNVYTTGYFSGTVDFDPGASTLNLTAVGEKDIFISKLGATGNFVWAKSMGGTLEDGGSAIALDASGNVYTTGLFSGIADFDPGSGTYNLTSAGSYDIFISKLDPSGNFVWAKNIGDTLYDEGSGIKVDAAGNVYITGYFLGTADFDPDSIGNFNLTSTGADDIYILKLNALGNFVWAKRMGGDEGDWGQAIASDGSGNIYVTGGYGGTVDFDPGSGTFNLTAEGNTDIFISKLDSAGNFVWAKGIGGTNRDYSNSSTTDAAGNVYATGIFSGTADFDPNAGTFNLSATGGYDVFVLKLNTAGNLVWAKMIGGGSNDYAFGLALDASGNIYTTGDFINTVDFDPDSGIFTLTSSGSLDAFISKLDTAGNFVWAKKLGGTNFEVGISIAANAQSVYTTGNFNRTCDFDPDAGILNLTSAGYGDIFVHKMTSSGVGINEWSAKSEFQVYPNPATSVFTIQYSGVVGQQLAIYNVLGVQVYKDNWLPAQSQRSIDVAALPKGLYMIRIGEEIQKIIIE